MKKRQLMLSLLFLCNNTFADGDHKSFALLPTVQEELHCEEIDLVSSAFKASAREAIECQDVHWVGRQIEMVKALTPVAPKVNLELYRRDSGASFDIGHTLRIPLFLTFTDRWGQVFNSLNYNTDAIIYHEYSHAVFGEIIGKKLYPNFKKDAETLSKLKIGLQRAYAKGNPGGISNFYTKRIEVMSKNLREHEEIERHSLASSYNELFADLVSVLVTDDNNAILKALYYDEMTDESYETIKLRSFDDQGTKYDNRLLNEEHGELALVRQFIGTKILPSFKNQENILELKRKLIDNLLIAIESQMRERIATKQFKISPLINNQALIEELKLFYPKLSY